jgi:hypothetical protein
MDTQKMRNDIENYDLSSKEMQELFKEFALALVENIEARNKRIVVLKARIDELDQAINNK